jgi:hypothetical protein
MTTIPVAFEPSTLFSLSRNALCHTFLRLDHLVKYLTENQIGATLADCLLFGESESRFIDRLFLRTLNLLCPPEPEPALFSREVRHFTRLFLVDSFLYDRGENIYIDLLYIYADPNKEWHRQHRDFESFDIRKNDTNSIMAAALQIMCFIYSNCQCPDIAYCDCLNVYVETTMNPLKNPNYSPSKLEYINISAYPGYGSQNPS